MVNYIDLAKSLRERLAVCLYYGDLGRFKAFCRQREITRDALNALESAAAELETLRGKVGRSRDRVTRRKK